MALLIKLKEQATGLRQEIYAIYLAEKDPRTPWYAKALAVCVVGYAFSPIDLIPDFIPVLGLLDDLILIPLGVILATKLIPENVLDDCRQKAAKESHTAGRKNWIFAGIIIFAWIAFAAALISFAI